MLVNDTGDNSPLTASILDGPQFGTIILNTNGSFVYLPNAGFEGNDTFTYEVSEATGANATGTVTIHVQAPAATDDSYAIPYYRRLKAGSYSHTTESGPMDASVLANDQVIADETLSAELVSGPTSGSLVFDRDGSFVYTPDEDFVGSDTFTYKLIGDGIESNIATVTIAVENFLPDATDDSYTVMHDTPLAAIVPYEIEPEETPDPELEVDYTSTTGVLANDTDEDTDWLTTVLLSGPAHGTLVLEANGTFLYTPDAGFVGEDSFTYAAHDGLQNSAAATVFIEVIGSNWVAVDDSFNVSHDGRLMSELVEDPEDPESFILTGPDLLLNDELDGNYNFQASVVINAAHGTLVLEANGIFTYTPDAGFVGTDSFTYSITDGVVTSNAATVTIDDVNDAPTANDDNYTMQHGFGVIGGLEDATELVDWIAGPDLLENDANPDEDDLTTILVTDVSHGSLVFYSDGTFNYRPDDSFVGTDSFTYKVSDGAAESAAATVILEVTNSSPVAVGESFSVVHDGLLAQLDDSQSENPGSSTLLANDSDADGDRLLLSIETGPTHGTLNWENNGAFTYTPDAGYVGNDSFTYRVSDGFEVSDLATVTIDVVNDAPIAEDNDYSIEFDEILLAGKEALLFPDPNLLSNDTDAQDDPLSATLVSLPTNGTLTWHGNGSFIYEPNAGFYGSDSFQYSVNDGIAESNIATVTIDVGYTPPTMTDDEFTVANDQVLVVGDGGSYYSGIFLDESDETDARLFATIDSGPSHGTITQWLDNGTFTYTPDVGYVGDDTISLLVDDGIRSGLTTTVTIHVTAASGVPTTISPELTAANTAFRQSMLALEEEWQSFVQADHADAQAADENALSIQTAWQAAYDAAEASYLAATAASQAAYYDRINEAEADFSEVLETLTKSNTNSIQAADAALLSAYAANSSAYREAVAAADSAYRDAVDAADQQLRNAQDAHLDTYGAALAAADATYEAGVTAIGLVFDNAAAMEQTTYENVERESWDAYQDALAETNLTYQTAVDAAAATRDAVLAQYPDVIYNPGAVDTDPTFISAVAAADTALDAAVEAANNTYTATVDAGNAAYTAAVSAAEVVYDAGLDAAAAAFSAAEEAAESDRSAARDAADAVYDQAYDVASAANSAAQESADLTYDNAADAAQAAYNATVAAIPNEDIEAVYEAALYDLEVYYQILNERSSQLHQRPQPVRMKRRSGKPK